MESPYFMEGKLAVSEVSGASDLDLGELAFQDSSHSSCHQDWLLQKGRCQSSGHPSVTQWLQASVSSYVT